MNDKKIQAICFKNALRQLREINSKKDLISFKILYKEYSYSLGVFKSDFDSLLKNKELQLKKLDNNKSNVIIGEPTSFKPLNFNIKGLNSVEKKISKIDNSKLKFEFEGLFNLLNDRTNLVYNNLYTRKQIVEDLNKFKSLKFFKVNYLSRYNLKNEYKFLSYKNNTTIGHSKLYFIKNGLYVLKTLKKDDITLKAFYVGNRYKTLLNKSTNKVFCPLKGDKFNLSSIDAYKTLEKKDSIKYYRYCNNNGLDKKNRQLLREIRRTKKLSRDSLIESLEEKKEELEDSINNKVLSDLDRIYLELQLQDIEKSLNDLKSYDEDNSMERKTILDDYF